MDRKLPSCTRTYTCTNFSHFYVPYLRLAFGSVYFYYDSLAEALKTRKSTNDNESLLHFRCHANLARSHITPRNKGNNRDVCFMPLYVEIFVLFAVGRNFRFSIMRPFRVLWFLFGVARSFECILKFYRSSLFI